MQGNVIDGCVRDNRVEFDLNLFWNVNNYLWIEIDGAHNDVTI
jgi:hypothetical protein